ncbi:MAG TPA: hypothetical protein VNP04_28010 [Alphaproteobacteria bacterium]|nr:hypothetical protein [Alphaproteobacteria bacterium]
MGSRDVDAVAQPSSVVPLAIIANARQRRLVGSADEPTVQADCPRLRGILRTP